MRRKIYKELLKWKNSADRLGFQVVFLDCGLFASMCEAPPKTMLFGNKVFVEFQGAFTEQYVMQQLKPMDIPIYYWANDTATQEIDFLIQVEDRVIPVEVKASVNVKAKSLQNFVSSNPDLKGLRFSMLPYTDQGWMENVPLFGISAYLKPGKE